MPLFYQISFSPGGFAAGLKDLPHWAFFSFSFLPFLCFLLVYQTSFYFFISVIERVSKSTEQLLADFIASFTLRR